MTTDVGRSGANAAHIYFPLDHGERAAHLDVNHLLPRDVYERLAELIQRSLPAKDGRGDAEADAQARFFKERGHRAVFLDGDRGTGKTTVAVNLRAYLEAPEVRKKYPDLAGDVHILKPIDPTQLEESDDLFLNVIVAAVLSDDDVKKALEGSPSKRQDLHDKLQALGEALQGRETQESNYGLDRLRSFMGTQALAFAVHQFFVATLALLKKRLIVMPIDDVDTSLHKAFDYLEVVRRYLSSHVVLPIVCGDFRLYREVTQRDSYRRFSVSGKRADDLDEEVTSHLAIEYLRKVLPLQRRLQMPSIATLLDDSRIVLVRPRQAGAEGRVTLPQFMVCLRALLAGPVNEHENSALHIPIPTVRALSQLAGSIQDQFETLEHVLFGSEPALPSTDLMKRLLLTSLDQRILAEPVARTFDGSAAIMLDQDRRIQAAWGNALLEYFRFVPDASHVCLVLLASRHWRDNLGRPRQVFATPLFSPLTAASSPELKYCKPSAKIYWREELQGRMPQSWLLELPDQLVVPFPKPEIGWLVPPASRAEEREAEHWMKEGGQLLLSLVIQRNYYTLGRQADLLCTGRILELVVTSLVREVTIEDVQRIAADSPFHSVAAIAKTKALTIAGDEEEMAPVSDMESPSSEGVEISDMESLVSDIRNWRKDNDVEQLALSPWLIYCAINKTLNQTALFYPSGTKLGRWREATDFALATFNAFWAACASFEKGPVFGLSRVLSNVNLSPTADFEKNPLYLQNVMPLLSDAAMVTSPGGDRVLSVTRLLKNHPLRKLIKFVRDQRPEPAVIGHSARNRDKGPKAQLFSALQLRSDMVQLREVTIVNALLRMHPDPARARRHGLVLLKKFAETPGLTRELRTLERAVNRIV